MNDDVAIVTGGTRGIGKQVSLRLAERGVTVVATYHSDEESATETKRALDQYDAPTTVTQFDVSDYEAVRDAFEAVEDEFGPVTILVNNAGIHDTQVLMRMDPEEWNRLIETNLTGTFNCAKTAVRSMMFNDGGRIVNVSSVAALRGWRGQSHYAASKAGILGFTRSLARETGEFDDKSIRVNAVVPGYTDTGIVGDLQDDDDGIDEDIPHDRLADPAEIAESIVYLVSDDASYVHGEVHRIDGGLLS